MRTKVVVVLLVMTALVAFAAPMALAAEPAGEQMAAAPGDAKMKYFTVAAFSCAIGIAIAAFGGALGQGRGLASAVEGIARNPGATGRIRGDDYRLGPHRVAGHLCASCGAHHPVRESFWHLATSPSCRDSAPKRARARGEP
jgi:F-type H+-transporting ATPase subunit c